jgi:diguanylate cyclase (GGDEF)-like protein/PAS domain S-box-containing protein
MFYIGKDMAVKQASVINTVKDIKTEVTVGHLWLEDVLLGDKHESTIDEVWHHFDRARWKVNALLNGDINEKGVIFYAADSSLHSDVLEIMAYLEEFKSSAKNRYEFIGNSGVGTLNDQLFDSLFITLSNKIVHLDEKLQKRIRLNHQQYHWLGVLLIILTVIISIAHAIILFRRESTLIKNNKELLAVKEQLQESEEKYRLAMIATQDGLWDWNLSTGEVYFSPRWAEILGEESLENNYSVWEERLYDEDKKHVLQSIQKHLNGDTVFWQQEHRLRDCSNQYKWVLGRGQVIKRSSKGKPLRMIGTMTDISDKKKSEEIIWHQANYDSLTKIPNRKLFQELLDNEINHSLRNNTQLWVLFLDLDGFKEVNDSFGHLAGDELLIQVSQRIKNIIRKSDIVARLSGDEFVIILSDITQVAGIDKIASNLIQNINKKFKLNNSDVYISCSIGIACFPTDASTSSDLIKFSDQAMYKSKKAGKNQYTYFEQSFQSDSIIRMEMSKDLRESILKDEFLMYYQPIVDLKTGDTYKAEALIRWQHPVKGLLSPGDFIPLAEETGIICDLSLWIFDSVFKQLNDWQVSSNKSFQISINMSPVQLRSKEEKYCHWLKGFQTNNISGDNIAIEITEGVLIKDEPMISKKLLQFRDQGIQVAIDDFGTGYSSLSYIKEFHIDYLKIDQSFVRNMVPDSKEVSLCKAIIVMAHELNLKVIAEGVETEQQLDILKTMGCDFAQGYLFSKPLPAEEFKKLFIR